jgi:hypothetical protein
MALMKGQLCDLPSIAEMHVSGYNMIYYILQEGITKGNSISNCMKKFKVTVFSMDGQCQTRKLWHL